MFRHDHPKPASRVRGAQQPSTVLGEGTRWQGDLHVGPEGLRIEGSLEGTLVSEGPVVVAPSGQVKGTLQVGDLAVSGRVEGVVRVAGCLEIHGTGWVEGEIELGTLVVDEGATLQGTCVPRSAAMPARESEPIHPRRDERMPERPPHVPSPEAAVPAVPVRSVDKSRLF